MKRPPAKDLIAALERARRHIESCDRYYICLALHWEGQTKREQKAAMYLRRYISRRLGNATTLDDWCRTNGVRVHRYRTARLQWIDWMIASIKETG